MVSYSLAASPAAPANQLSGANKAEFFRHVYEICPQCQTHQECLCNGFHLQIRPINQYRSTAITLAPTSPLMDSQKTQDSQTEEPTNILQVKQQ